jgi:hypothetical protein
MVKAAFERNQKVWVDGIDTWAVIERLIPVWAKDIDEPVRITYDVGLGREFTAAELRAQDTIDDQDISNWRILRAKNKWQTLEECQHHPFPGTYPVVVTDANDWGGWRTPGAEYDRDPAKIERQARLIQMAPRLQALAAELIALVAEAPDEAPPELLTLARRARAIEAQIKDLPPPVTRLALDVE